VVDALRLKLDYFSPREEARNMH